MSDLNQQFITDLTPEDISWDDLRSCYELWLSKRGEKKFPSRKDFTMHNLKHVLPFITIISVDYEPLVTTFRLIGTVMTEMMGFDITNESIADYPQLDTSRKHIEWLVTNRKPYFIKDSPMYWARGQYTNFSVLSLPLSDDGETINKVLTICHFH